MNKGITIRARIGLTMAFLAALLVAIGVLGLFGMSSSNDAYRATFMNQMPSAVAIDNAELYAARERLALDRAAFMMGTAEAAGSIDRSHFMRKNADEWWKKYLALPRDADEDRLAQAVAAKREELHQVMQAFAATVIANDPSSLVDGAKRLQAVYTEMSVDDDALRAFQFAAADKGFTQAQSTFDTFRLVGFGALIAGLAAAVFSYLTLRRAIGRPLADALGHFEAIAAGDLRREIVVHSTDEMGQLLQGVAKMQRSLTGTVRSVRMGSESIATATRQISAGNLDLSSRTEEQASALQQTASSMEQLTGTVKQNADNARQASSLAANASEIASRGNAVVGQVVGTMGDINQSSAKIADIISIIEGIAFQTNILALNAAVEAARAGEEGRGFAVVAGEVRSLAQRSSAAAKEIKALIDTSVERVQAGSALVDQAGRTMTEIIGAVQRVTDIMGEIAAASTEQSSGIDQVARAVTQMDEVTQQNAALVEEAAAAAQSLEDQATKLRTAVSVFQLGDEASAGAVASEMLRRREPAPAPVRTPVKALATNARTRLAPATATRPLAMAVAGTGTERDWETF
ncbi:hypothetical protein BWP39_01135 [Paraburkholderia acidicola]|uniref:Methyl-accepting chemotaxis sensory transducer with TarH sensor n=1 Tax=Paraburkholderia acidicola TaxID=1912599 RepID=A0A2A4F8U8_9BURK|nr:methyl-accepting chemotaxis protein [Paraburkholderia acidicola]PCE28826.1 hypothetical protein BWP39_01135 [Paraburkholderia acidicola]